MSVKRVVIIGGGIAGTTVAEGLASTPQQFHTTLIDREMHPLYSRVLLPHYLRGQIPRERVFLKKEAWYAEKGIDWMRGIEVLMVDTKNKYIQTSEGREIPYDTLIIAGGGDAHPCVENINGICYLRGIDDADTILSTVARARAMGAGNRAVVIGGSFIAVEFLNYFHHTARLETHICMRGSGLWSNMIDHVLQKRLADHVAQEGAILHPNCAQMDIQGEDWVKSVHTNHDTIDDVGIVGTGTGLDMNIDCLPKTEIQMSSHGVHVDEYLKTKDPHIYAIGDIAHYMDIHTGRQRTVGNWQNAFMQAKYIVKSLMGDKYPFNLVTSYATNVLGLEVTFIGDTSRSHVEKTHIIHEDETAIELFERDQCTVGAVIIGQTKNRMQITKSINEHTYYDTQS